MMESPFAFFRGAALIMASDLSGSPNSGFEVQLCGDAHLSNFGLFASPERTMMFDINDFDETLPGPWEWDVKRLAASVEIAGRDRGFAKRSCRAMVMAGVHEYRVGLRNAARMRTLEAWYSHMEADEVLGWINQEVASGRLKKKEARQASRDIAKARIRDSIRASTKLTDNVDGELRIVADPPLIVPIEDLVLPGRARQETERSMRQMIDSYRETLLHEHHPLEEFHYVHLARKVVGVGSVGTRAWVFLMLGRDDHDPLLLQAKEAQASVLEQFVGPSKYNHHGQRVVVGQHLMQAASDIFLGWQRVQDIDGQTRDYYVRQMHDWKGSIEVENLGTAGLELYSRMCGAALARAHARSGDRIAIAAYLGRGDKFETALARFATSYADQNERDYEAFVQAIDAGRLPAEPGL